MTMLLTKPASYKMRLVLFLGMLLPMIVMVLAENNMTLYFDSLKYWDLRTTFIKDGTFSLLNFGDKIRGYFFPLCLLNIANLASALGIEGIVLVRLFMAVLFGVLIVWIIPGIMERSLNISIRPYQIVLYWLVMMFFWRGYLLYPLSDFVSVFLFALALFLVYDERRPVWILFIAGACIGAATIVRPSYLLSAILFGVWIGYNLGKAVLQQEQRRATALVQVLALLIGFSLPLIPQYGINVRHFGVPSPFVQATSSAGNLYLLQIKGGLEVQRYETYIGKRYPAAGVNFFDPHGEDILLRERLKAKPFSETGKLGLDRPVEIRQFAAMFLKYPFDFIAIYSRHTINGLDATYDTLYIKNLRDRLLNYRRFVNFTLLFLGGIFVVLMIHQGGLKPEKALILLAVLASSLVSIPTEVEIRFFIPVFLVFYAFALYGIFNRMDTLRAYFAGRWASFIVAYVIFMLLVFTITANTFAHLQYGWAG